MDWLAFSLSNHHHQQQQQHQQCFFEPFAPSAHHHGGVVMAAPEQDGEQGTTSVVSTADMAMLGAAAGAAGMPKLEDFLGCAGAFSGGGDSPTDASAAGPCGYDSDLKTIAAGFLGGFPPEQQQPNQLLVLQQQKQKQQQQLLLESDGSVTGAVSAGTDSKKAVDTFGQRTSIYRGVTKHRWTGRYEAHLWDNSCRREGQSRKGRQVYLGGYDKEEKAARAYDLAALKYWGPTTTTNFPVSNYEKELEEMKEMTRQEFVASLRRKSSGFSRGASIYRGVTRHHQHGRWQARIGRVAGNKDLYLGTFSTQEEAAEAYDIAAIKFRGLNAVTNFDMSRYDVKSIANSDLPIGGISAGGSSSNTKTSSSSKTAESPSRSGREMLDLAAATASFAMAAPMRKDEQQNQQLAHHTDYWSMLALQQQQQQQAHPYLAMYPPSGVTFDFSSPSTVAAAAQGNGNGYMWSNGGGIVDHHNHNQQEQSQSSSSCSIPYATPIALGSGGGGGYETATTHTTAATTAAAAGYGGPWVSSAGDPAMHHAMYHQPAKANMGLFQTPIFGME